MLISISNCLFAGNLNRLFSLPNKITSGRLSSLFQVQICGHFSALDGVSTLPIRHLLGKKIYYEAQRRYVVLYITVNVLLLKRHPSDKHQLPVVFKKCPAFYEGSELASLLWSSPWVGGGSFNLSVQNYRHPWRLSFLVIDGYLILIFKMFIWTTETAVLHRDDFHHLPRDNKF